MNNLIKYTLAFLAVILIVFGCRKEQPEMNNDNIDCSCYTKTNADFSINEVRGYNLPSSFETETDTIYKKRNVHFIATDTLQDSYEWKLGAETITERDYYRFFDNTTGGQNITVTLIARKEVNQLCFPDDDGVDTVTKTFHVSNVETALAQEWPNNYYGMEGTYRVKDELNNATDSVDMYIERFYLNGMQNGFFLKNLTTNDSLDLFDERVNYRELRSHGSYTVDQGRFIHRLDGSVQFEFIDVRDFQNQIKHNYLGRKL